MGYYVTEEIPGLYMLFLKKCQPIFEILQIDHLRDMKMYDMNISPDVTLQIDLAR